MLNQIYVMKLSIATRVFLRKSFFFPKILSFQIMLIPINSYLPLSISHISQKKFSPILNEMPVILPKLPWNNVSACDECWDNYCNNSNRGSSNLAFCMLNKLQPQIKQQLAHFYATFFEY